MDEEKSEDQAWDDLYSYLEEEEKKQEKQRVRQNRWFIVLLFGILFMVLFSPIFTIGYVFIFIILAISQPIVLGVLVFLERKKRFILSISQKRILGTIWCGLTVTYFYLSFKPMFEIEFIYLYYADLFIPPSFFIFLLSTVIFYILFRSSHLDRMLKWEKQNTPVQ